jgi:ribose 5-phosphate isomerase A
MSVDWQCADTQASPVVSFDAKWQVARAALAELPSEGVIGLGTGSTSRLFITELCQAIRAGKRYVGVATSEACRRHATELGIPLLGEEGPWDIAVCVDGADEVDANLDLIKGSGGAHTREKIVNQCARKNVIIVDDSKLSSRLGERSPVPVEVLAFGHGITKQRLSELGRATLRLHDGVPWRTDAGNLVYDVACGPISDPGSR